VLYDFFVLVWCVLMLGHCHSVIIIKPSSHLTVNSCLANHISLYSYKMPILIGVSGCVWFGSRVKPQLHAVKWFERLAGIGLSENLVVVFRDLSQRECFIIMVFPVSDGRRRRMYRLW